MKFQIEMTIDKSRQEVWDTFDSSENSMKWQPTLKSFERVSGEPGQPGAVSKLTYNENGREVILMETITRRQEPEAFDGTYEGAGVINHIKNNFIEIADGKTKWVMETEFQFQSLPMRLLGPLMKGSFAKRTEQDMQRFKELAEG